MALIDAIRTHLLEHGPASPEELLAALRASGATTAKTPQGISSSLSSSRLTYRRADGTWDLQARRLAGVVLTTRPRSRLADGVLWVHRDLEPFTLVGKALPLATGGVAQWRGDEVATLVGPRGWLPDTSPHQLLALRWTGSALQVDVVDRVASDVAVRRAQSVLRDHVTSAGPRYYRSDLPTDLCLTVLSALSEVPDLFAEPLPPLRELLPLPERFSAETGVWEAHGDRSTVTVRLPARVYDELSRRAGLLGDDVRDYAALLLGAAADRLTPAETCRSCRYEQDWAYRSWRDLSRDDPSPSDLWRFEEEMPPADPSPTAEPPAPSRSAQDGNVLRLSF